MYKNKKMWGAFPHIQRATGLARRTSQCRRGRGQSQPEEGDRPDRRRAIGRISGGRVAESAASDEPDQRAATSNGSRNGSNGCDGWDGSEPIASVSAAKKKEAGKHQ